MKENKKHGAVKKADVIKLANLTRDFFSTKFTAIQVAYKETDKILKQSEKLSFQYCGSKTMGIPFEETFASLCGGNAIKRCTDEEIIAVLNLLGVEVEE